MASQPVIDFTPYIINGKMYIEVADHDVLKILVMGAERVLKSRQIGRDRLAISVAAGTASTNKRSSKQLHTIIQPTIPKILNLIPADSSTAQILGMTPMESSVSVPTPAPAPFPVAATST